MFQTRVAVAGVGLLFCSLGLLAGEQPAEEISEAGMRAVYGPAAAILNTTPEAPQLDGRLDDPAWNRVPAQPLGYADQRVAGQPINSAWVKVVAAGSDLFAAFHTEGAPHGPQANEPDNANVLNNHCVALTWKTDEAVCLAAVNVRGILHHAKRQAGGTWDKSWNPEQAEAKVARTDLGWDAEIRLPLAHFKNKDGKVPPLLRVDFLRRFWWWSVPVKAMKIQRSWQAWKPRPLEAVERLVKQDLREDADFGILWFPGAQTALAEETIASLREASKTARLSAAAEGEQRKARKAGFEFSAEELEKVYPGAPALFVPLVEHPPAVDAEPGDEAWRACEPVALGFLSEKIKGGVARNRTLAKAVTDKENLYVLFVCEEESPEGIKASPKGGELWKEDVCNLLLDVGRTLDLGLDNYVDFLINAANCLEFSRRRSDTVWSPRGLKSAAKIYPAEKKWVVELAIGFADLGLAPECLPKLWGANFLRSRTSSRGVWIDRTQTEDLAYLNYDFAWRGNIDSSPHRPDRFGLLYLQTGNALPAELHAALAARDGPEAAGRFKRWALPPPKPLLTQAPPKPAPPAFAQEPSVTLKDGRAEISFALTVPADVTLSIHDPSGRCVRRLAAGLLGEKAPAPLQAGALRQTIVWDLSDDAGKKVPPGSYTVRVGTGLRAVFERHLLFNPNALKDVRGLACDAKGDVYVIQEDRRGWGSTSMILVFNREGQYQRQLVPFSGALPPEKLKGAQLIELPGGRWQPSLHDAEHEPFAPGQGNFAHQRFAVDPAGAIVLLNGLNNTDTLFPKRLLRIQADGGLGSDYLGPVLGFHGRMGGLAAVALSPDGRFVYVTGMRGGLGAHEGTDFPHHAVYRFEWATGLPKTVGAPDSFAPPFLGEFRKAGKDAVHFSDPRGLCTDPQGNLYVADRGNARIAAFKPDGTPLGELAVQSPEQVEIHPKSGALYVLSLGKEESSLVKYTGLQAGAPALKLSLPAWNWARMALDGSGPSPRLWLIGVKPGDRGGTSNEVLTVEELDKEFKSLGTLIADAGFDVLGRRYGLPSYVDCQVDYDGAKAAIWGVAFDTATGRPSGTGHEIRRQGLDGRLYVLGAKKDAPGEAKPQVISRFDPSGAPLPFPGTPEGALPTGKGTVEFAVDAKGRIFLLRTGGVDVYDADGRLEKKDFILVPGLPGTSNGVNGVIRVDREGCTYINAFMKPLSAEIPPELQGRLPEVEVRPSLEFVYQHLYGSVIKFGPQGGRVVMDKEGDWAWCLYLAGRGRCKAEGVQWAHLGMSPVRYRNVEQLPCTCEASRFDVDEYGRVFLPDALRSAAEILDKNGNVLLRFGRWGNMDDDFRKAGEPTQPALAWPIAIDVRGDKVFVIDKVNRRVVMMRLTHTAEAAAKVSVP